MPVEEVSGRRRAVLAGVGAYVPPRVVTNDDLACRLDTSDEWIRSRTGIRERRVVERGQATSDLAVAAGTAALAHAAAQPDGHGSVDAVVLATATPDHPCPATAPAVAAALGLGHVAAFDIGAVCSGFVYGLAVADGLIATGVADRVLLVGADVFSAILDPADRGTGVVFGDGAGAVVLRSGRADEPGALLATDLGSDGTLTDLITVPAGGSRHPARSGACGTVGAGGAVGAVDTDSANGAPDPAQDRWFRMQGQAVYRHAVSRMTQSATAVLDRVGWTVADVDLFVGHQANARILATVGTRLGLAPERVHTHVQTVGNTVAASVPLALADAVDSRVLRGGDRVVLSAFGGGASWGAAALTWPDLRPT